MATAKIEELTKIYLEQNYEITHEKRGIKGIIEWWAKIKEREIGKDLVISTVEKYDRIILNGKIINEL